MPANLEALRRIAEARTSKATMLDLGDLLMDSLPEELSGIPTLQVLALGRRAVRMESETHAWSYSVKRPRQRFSSIHVLKQLPLLQTLDLSGCQSLKNVDGLQDLRRLQTLNLSECKSLKNVDGLQDLRRLQSLNLAMCYSLENLDGLQNLHTLQTLDLRGCVLLTNVDALKKLHHLQTLDLSQCQSLKNVDGLKNVLGLQTLDLSGCRSLKNVNGLKNLRYLLSLNLTSCQSLKNVDTLQNLRYLQTLNLGLCEHLTNVDALKNLHHLQTLDLSQCQSLKNVDALQDLRRLQTLNLRWCEHLTNVDALKNLHHLQTLDLSGCQSLKNVDALQDLRRLQTLKLRWCEHLTNVDALKNLHHLQTLSLSNCTRLRHFYPLRNLLSQLRSLYLFECRFTDLDSTACGQHRRENVLEAVRSYYDDSDHGVRADKEVKVFILGNGSVGKTQLCRRLRGKPFLENSRSTAGIKVKHINIALHNSATSVRLNLWDFGGQDIYHGTHHLFLHKQAVFILVWTPDTEKGEYEEAGVRWRHRPLVYWLDYIRSISGTDNPVLLVQGKCDPDGNSMPQHPSLPGDFSSLTRLEFSAKQDDKLQRLRVSLEQAVASLLERNPAPEISIGRIQLAQSLRGMLHRRGNEPDTRRRRTLSLKDFRILCKENGKIENWQEALKFLHRRGVVFWRPDLFRGRIILDQSWALRAIYSLFNRARERPGLFQGGRFTRDAVADAWENHTVDAQRTFLSMMESCGICFRARRVKPGDYQSEWEYIAPELLPELDTPDIQRQLVGPLPAEPLSSRLQVRYEFLHEGVLRSFLSWLGENVGDKAVYWKYGCRFYDPRRGVQMNIDTPPDAWKNGQAGTVNLAAWGDDAAKWLEACLNALQWISPAQTPEIERTGFEAHDRLGGKNGHVIVNRLRDRDGLGRISLPTPGRENKGSAERKWKGCYVLVKLLLRKKQGDVVAQRSLCRELNAETEEEYSPNTVGNYLQSLEKITGMDLFELPEEESGVPYTLLPGADEGLNMAKRYIEQQLDIVMPKWRQQPWAK